jgi:thiol-disulfide isomerase/thioredoxin
MRRLPFFVALLLLVGGGGGLYAPLAAYGADKPAAAAPKPGEPTDTKARKTWDTAIEWERRRDYNSAVGSFRKANEQDRGRCSECLRRAYMLALGTGNYKDAEAVAREMLANATTPEGKARVHYMIGVSLQREGLDKKKDKCFDESCDEFRAALNNQQDFNNAHFNLGISLAHLHQDEEARKQFAAFLDQDRTGSVLHLRAERYLGNLELARPPMAPPFAITTLDGQHISLDALTGKVVLVDFWATWCGPCREALPNIRNLAHKFAEQPLVILSISVDKDETKWKDFVARNGMTWLQYRDAGFNGTIAKLFGVHAIPATFTIDADGVLEDQHVGDADIEHKLKKLVAHAAEAEKRKDVELATEPSASTN